MGVQDAHWAGNSLLFQPRIFQDFPVYLKICMIIQPFYYSGWPSQPQCHRSFNLRDRTKSIKTHNLRGTCNKQALIFSMNVSDSML